MDAHLSRDGVVMIAHDPDGERMASVGSRIAESTASEIKTWDVGLGFQGALTRPAGGFEMPTLDEVLEEFPDIVINIDLKDHRRELVSAILATVTRHRAAERVQLASFDLGTLLQVRRRGYLGRTALAPPEVAAALFAPALLFRLMPWTGECAQIPSHAQFTRQSPDEVGDVTGVPGSSRARLARLQKQLFPRDGWLLRRLHRLDLRVDFWTINDPDEARALAELGADGIMTDDPRAIAAALKRAPAGESEEDTHASA